MEDWRKAVLILVSGAVLFAAEREALPMFSMAQEEKPAIWCQFIVPPIYHTLEITYPFRPLGELSRFVSGDYAGTSFVYNV